MHALHDVPSSNAIFGKFSERQNIKATILFPFMFFFNEMRSRYLALILIN